MGTLNSTKLYDKFAPYYRSYSAKKRAYLDSVDSLIIKNVPFTNFSMLDVGSGDGIRAYNLFKKLKAKKLTLIDNSRRMFELSKKIKGANAYLVDITSKDTNQLKENYELIICLWNVFGHITTYKKRLAALRNMKKLLKKDGVIVCDVNNRYNLTHYGVKIFAKNLFRDIIAPSIKNGDVITNLKMSTKVSVPYFCHFFSPFEFDRMIKSAGLKIIKKYYINYKNGNIEKNFLRGQIVYFLTN